MIDKSNIVCYTKYTKLDSPSNKNKIVYGGERVSLKKFNQSLNNTKAFRENAEDESYERYKKVCYSNIILKSLLFFLLGVLTAHIRSHL